MVHASFHLLVEVVVQEAADEQVEQGLLAVLVMPQHRELMQGQQLAARPGRGSVLSSRRGYGLQAL